MTSLDPQAQALLDGAARSGLPPVYELTIEQARTRMRAAFISEFDTTVITENRESPGPAGPIAVRKYSTGTAAEAPAVIFFHGGGWTVNDLDTHDRLCALIAEQSSCSVLSVDFRRSPEAKYPNPLLDAYTATKWIAENAGELGVDARRLCLAGDSSGGTLAIGVALLSRDEGGPDFRQLVLMYPVTDYITSATGSYLERGRGYSLDRKFMEWAWHNYLPADWSRDDPYLFPMRATLDGLPPTLLLTAEFDPLRDEGIAFAASLRGAGIEVDHWHYEDQMHGFAMQTKSIARAADAVSKVAAAIHDRLYA
ncbi:alpha/beta hydrolase [Saccharothrix stipae]